MPTNKVGPNWGVQAGNFITNMSTKYIKVVPYNWFLQLVINMIFVKQLDR